MRARGARAAGLLLLVGFVLVGTACGPRLDAHRAERIALDDQRLDQFLDDHPYEVTEVRRARDGSSHHLVRIELDEGVPTTEYPLDTCDIDRSPDVVTGVGWLVDVPGDRVVAVSPRWREVDCLAGA